MYLDSRSHLAPSHHFSTTTDTFNWPPWRPLPACKPDRSCVSTKIPTRDLVHAVVQLFLKNLQRPKWSAPALAPESPPRKATSASNQKPACPSTTQVVASAIVKSKTAPKQNLEATSKSKKPVSSAEQECSICATTKSTKRSFNLSGDGDSCDHFKTICNRCIGKMFKTKATERQFAGYALVCPFPNCQHTLDTTALRHAVSKAIFEE